MKPYKRHPSGDILRELMPKQNRRPTQTNLHEHPHHRIPTPTTTNSEIQNPPIHPHCGQNDGGGFDQQGGVPPNAHQDRTSLLDPIGKAWCAAHCRVPNPLRRCQQPDLSTIALVRNVIITKTEMDDIRHFDGESTLFLRSL